MSTKQIKNKKDKVYGKLRVSKYQEVCVRGLRDSKYWVSVGTKEKYTVQVQGSRFKVLLNDLVTDGISTINNFPKSY